MEHYCEFPNEFPEHKFHQKGIGKGKYVLLVGESPAPNGWRKSGKACYSPEGKLLPTGKSLNELLTEFGLSVEICGFTELSKCFVGKYRKQLQICSQKCWPILLRQLASSKYKLLVILGVETLRIFNFISGLNLQIGKLEKALVGNKEYSVLAIFHPSPINPNGRVKNKEIFQRLQTSLNKIIME